VSDILQLKLNTGAKMPAIGFGTWQLADGAEAQNAVQAALKTGYRLIDTARIYGNEESVGLAIEASGLDRSDLFIATKLWTSDQGYDSALRAFDQSMSRLGLEYLDLYLIHWPGHSAGNRKKSWRALTELQKQGRVKSIGVSNYQPQHLQELLENSEVVPAVNQIEFNPFIYDKQVPTLEFCAKHKIVVEAYSPLARGHSMNDKTLEAISKLHSKSVAQVMLRWAVQHGTVPIPKSSDSGRIKANLDVFDFSLNEQEMATIDGLSRGKSSLPFVVTLLK